MPTIIVRVHDVLWHIKYESCAGMDAQLKQNRKRTRKRVRIIDIMFTQLYMYARKGYFILTYFS